MWSRNKKKQQKIPTVLDGYLFQLNELDDDLTGLKEKRQRLKEALSRCEREIDYHIDQKVTYPSQGDRHDRHISAAQNKALGLASRIADVETAIDKKRQERLDLVKKIQGSQQSSVEDELQHINSSEEL